MRSRDQIRRQWDRWHGAYERRAFRIINREFRKLASGLPLENLTRNNPELLLQSNITQEQIFQVFVRIWTEVGTIHGRRVITQLEQEIGKKNKPLFNDQYQKLLIDYIRRFAGPRIVSVRSTYIAHLLKIIQNTMAEDTQQDLEPIRDKLYAYFKSQGFYRWEMMRIARTETTGAANYGALKAGDTVGIVQEKMWITNEDERTRRFPEDSFDHAIMDGVRLPKNTPFQQRGVSLQFPGDPAAQPARWSAGMVINCRCTVQMVPKRDDNGRLILRSSG